MLKRWVEKVTWLVYFLPFAMRSALITVGLVLLLIGLFWPVLSKLPLFRLPGDVVIDRPHLKVYFPITSMILISVVLTLLMRLLR